MSKKEIVHLTDEQQESLIIAKKAVHYYLYEYGLRLPTLDRVLSENDKDFLATDLNWMMSCFFRKAQEEKHDKLQ